MRRITLIAVAAGLTLSASACSSAPDGAATTTPIETSSTAVTTKAPAADSTTTTTATTTSVPTVEELTEAIDAFWALYVELGGSKAPFDPAVRLRLEERTTGDELVTLFDYLQSNAIAGYYIQGGIESSISLVSATETEAQVRDCYDDTTGLYRIDTNERVDADDPARHQVVYTLVNEAGTWKVSNILDEGAGCLVLP